MLIVGLFSLGLGCEDDGVGGDCPIGSGFEVKSGGQGGVKEEDYDEEYDDGGLSSILRLVQSLRVFGYGGGIGMVTGGDCREGLDAMAEEEALFLKI